jgi:DNA recombination protein RmuC
LLHYLFSKRKWKVFFVLLSFFQKKVRFFFILIILLFLILLMDQSLYILLVFAVLALLFIVIAFFMGRRGAGGGAQGMEALRAELGSTLASNMNLLANQMRDLTMTVNSRLGEQSGAISQRMDSASRLMADVRRDLGALSKAAEEIAEIGRDISSLEDILGSPKPRGGFGEYMLAELLAASLPSKYYDLQYTFRSGRRVDGILKLSGGLVSIDSKFPLENFSRIIEAASEDERRRARKDFAADCRRHIDAIASSYIVPEEGTLDFALMYVPAENVYYEMIINSRPDSGAAGGGILDHAFRKKVIPVSPNTFYLYLQTILMGLRGFEISERTDMIMKGLQRLTKDFSSVMTDLDTLGKHIRNASQKHDDLGVKVRTLGATLATLASGGEENKDGAEQEEM